MEYIQMEAEHIPTDTMRIQRVISEERANGDSGTDGGKTVREIEEQGPAAAPRKAVGVEDG
jgi:hypothetical protein